MLRKPLQRPLFLSLTALTVALILSSACSNTQFQASDGSKKQSTQKANAKPSPKPTVAREAANAEPLPNEEFEKQSSGEMLPDAPVQAAVRRPQPTPVPTTKPVVKPTTAPPPPPAPVPVNICDTKGPFKILILDLKSGWFAGDGGDFFKGFVSPQCKDTIEVAYAHITKEIIETNFDSVPTAFQLLPCLQNQVSRRFNTNNCTLGSLQEFNQVWVLSGDSADSADLRTHENFFKSIALAIQNLAQTKPTSAFFFGAGLGNIEHANTIAQQVFPDLGTLFAASPTSTPGTLPDPAYFKQFTPNPLKPGAGTKGTFRVDAPLFAGLAQLYDFPGGSSGAQESSDENNQNNQLPFFGNFGRTSSTTKNSCFADPIVSKAVTVVATDHCERASIAVGKSGTHKVVLEGNMARFYGTSPEDYYHKLMIYLLGNN